LLQVRDFLMPFMIVTALMMAQATAAQPAQPQEHAVKKAKPAQVCEYIEVTGSRSKRRVCQDVSGHLDLGPGVSDSAYGKAQINGSGTGSGEPTQH
jgi:hypothetical protein